jgi:hypothetical protein
LGFGIRFASSFCHGNLGAVIALDNREFDLPAHYHFEYLHAIAMSCDDSLQRGIRGAA